MIDTEASSILGMESTWFAVTMICLVLALTGVMVAGVLCFYRQRVTTPRHVHNAHNTQGYPPVSYSCEYNFMSFTLYLENQSSFIGKFKF